ncbi:MAG TPA: tetratricopeptide repeat protein [Myxococcaceae bacterium]|jgi:tetratricopeptide (TPR) repeat protein
MEAEDELSALCRRAVAALEVGHPQRAAADAVRIIGLAPFLAQGHLILGSALLALDKPGEALEAVDAGLAQRADEPRLHRMRSVTLFELKRFDEALEAANAALARNPELADAHSSRAFALSALGRTEEALEAVSKAIELEPDEPVHHAKLAEERLPSDPVLAERHARTALMLAPENVAALTLLGGALVRQGRGDEACEVWQEAIRLDPTAETPKAALVHHLDAELEMGSFRPAIRRTLLRGAARIPPKEAGLGEKLLAIVPLLGLLGTAKGLIGLSSLAMPQRLQNLKRRSPQLYALYQQLKEDEQAQPR